MGQRVSNQAVINIAGIQVVDKWTSAKISRIYRFTTKRTYGIPIIAQYTGVIHHSYYSMREDYLLRAASMVADIMEDVLKMRCEAIRGEEKEPQYMAIGYIGNEQLIELNFDIMRVGGYVFSICVFAKEGYEKPAQQMAGVAMKSLDDAVKELIIKPLH